VASYGIELVFAHKVGPRAALARAPGRLLRVIFAADLRVLSNRRRIARVSSFGLCVLMAQCVLGATSPSPCQHFFNLLEITMSYEDRDTYGMYKSQSLTSTAASDGQHNGHHGPGPHLMGADTLIGNDVVNKSSETLGDIKEIMLDMRTGSISYAVLAFGGFLGMGEKLFAVPWTALTLDTTNKCFVLDASKDRLESAPGFDKDMWPDMADTTWQKGINDFYAANQHHSV
jgi:sporulation protein YlmC with PRC-barrel domain